ncbi:CopG family transcriptional regulator [Bacillus sp. 165]|uniref:CopG family transcriptional regulator n=1 Tax=Bacillus sp. 165 TaxID=1529117 RepID=UPI001ADCEF3F|nr:CopG family transcriptional regulator [Bacillus sp. 165]MBO9129789.1 CopG family transcriptional regulator [Bacillus sp. 165]
MLVGEIIDRLNKKEPLSIIAKKLGMTPYTLSKKLRIIGYEYDSVQKKRVYLGDGDEPRELDITEVKSFAAEEDYNKLIYEELRAIRLMFQTKTLLPVSVLQGEKAKRTFSISKAVLERWDRFAKQQGITKSKLAEQAMVEFLNKYEEY